MTFAHRDHRIDFVRGIALLTIATDHIDHNLLGSFTLRNFGLSDMADVFVFVSGYVCGVGYGRVFESRGFLVCQRKALYRTSQLCLGWLIAFTCMWLVTCILQQLLGNTLDSDGGALGILSLYVWFLFMLPTMLWLRYQQRNLMLAVSLLIYITSQPLWTLFGRWQRLTAFNPFAWQFLFFLAVALSFMKISMWRFGRNAWMNTVIAVAILEAAFVAKLLHWEQISYFSEKANLGPLRVLHLFALLVVARFLLPAPDSQLWRKWVLQPLLLCGRNSLVTFCAGAILATVGTILLPRLGYYLGWQIVLSLGVCFGCVLAARIGEQWKRILRRQLIVRPTF